jgi:hypothetical protein
MGYGGYGGLSGEIENPLPDIPFPPSIDVDPDLVRPEFPEPVALIDVTGGDWACQDPSKAKIGEIFYDPECIEIPFGEIERIYPEEMTEDLKLYWWRLGTFWGSGNAYSVAAAAAAWARAFLKDCGMVPIKTFLPAYKWDVTEVYPSVLFWGPRDLVGFLSVIDKEQASRMAVSRATVLVPSPSGEEAIPAPMIPAAEKKGMGFGTGLILGGLAIGMSVGILALAGRR